MRRDTPLRMVAVWSPLILTAGLMVICVGLWTEILLYSQNTLYLNERWIVQKRMMKAGVMGADEFLLTRSPLAGNVLNLGDWHGFQEVIYREVVNPTEIRFRFKIPDDSYLDLTFGRNEGQFSGVRLSRRAAMPSIHYESSRDGRFLSQTPLRLPPISDRWHRARVWPHGTGLMLKIDSMTEIQLPVGGLEKGRVGFRSGYRGAVVDDVVIKAATHDSVVDTFRNTRRWAIGGMSCLALLLLIGAAVSVCSSKRLKIGYNRILVCYAVVSAAGVLYGSVWYAFDFHYWSRRQFFVLVQRLPSEKRLLPLHHFEKVRFKAFDWWNRSLGGAPPSPDKVVAQGYPADRFWAGPIYCGGQSPHCRTPSTDELHAIIGGEKKGYRVLFVGTSQTVGAGAETLDDTFVAGIHRRLSSRLPSSMPVDSLNISISGGNAEQLVAEYEYLGQYVEFSPDVVVINLSNNDPTEHFRAGLARWLEINSRNSVRTVFVAEANSAECELSAKLTANHETLRAVAKQNSVEVWSLHEFLRQADVVTSGSLWHDCVHLTSYGHEVTAEWLFQRLLETLTAGCNEVEDSGLNRQCSQGRLDGGAARP